MGDGTEEPTTGEVTLILAAAQGGDAAAREQVFGVVYQQLRRMAASQMRQQQVGHTFAPTDLVHEACLRLVDRDAPWESRAHFFCVAAKAMRSVLVDHARAKRSDKRGGKLERTPLHDAVAHFEERALDLVALDLALEELASFDERMARLTELRFFGGLSMPEIARVLGISLATTEREWAVARAWLRRRVGEP
ncbi:MAG: sigma-70 family RNA polymerase sigma factor [Planctomycetes bacterium]|nr:sigma-70 family RNA polymerase sigma factor [Planctomycetota bacterium]